MLIHAAFLCVGGFFVGSILIAKLPKTKRFPRFMQKKIFIVVLIAAIFGLAFYFDIFQYLSLDAFNEQREKIDAYHADRPILFAGVFFAIYVIATGFSLPGAAVLTLIAGALFGLWQGLLLVSFASTIGATIAFIMARTLLKDSVQARFGNSLKKINEGVERDGRFYLFSLRLVPAFPFFVINLVMALTPIKTWSFYWVSQLGMLPGTAVFVNAGTQLSEIESTSDILSPALIGSFVLLAAFPWIVKAVMVLINKRREEDVVQ